MRYALKLLSMRARTQKELATALERKGFSAEQSTVLEQLAKWGYLSDAQYANDRAASLLRMGRIGSDGIVRRLITAGISAVEARRAVEKSKAELEFDEVRTARALLAKRGIADRLPIAEERVRFKAARMLRARGFSKGTIESLLGELELDPPGQED
jgi:SOS response regulatory protein OraA/RecX